MQQNSAGLQDAGASSLSFRRETDCALPKATSIVDYYLSTTPKSAKGWRNRDLGSPAKFSGIYSVWNTPTKDWLPSKSRGSSASPVKHSSLSSAGPGAAASRAPTTPSPLSRDSLTGMYRAPPGYFDKEASPPPREISLSPQDVSRRERDPSTQEEGVSVGEIPGIGLTVQNKNISLLPDAGAPLLGQEEHGQGSRPVFTVSLLQIRNIFPNSPASRCDVMSPGDEILAVNSLCCRGRHWQDIVEHLSPTTGIHGRFGCRPMQPLQVVHIISRCVRRREVLYHASIVQDEETAHHTLTQHSAGNNEYRTAWRFFPPISFASDSWSRGDVRTFLEWVFWRQGSGFSISPSAIAGMPTGLQLLALSDENFGSMGFSQDESRVIRCVLGVLRGIATESA